MKKTLGGDRLGSGKKMTVDLHEYGRSTHDLGYLWRSTMAAGTLVPFLSKVMLPGDTWDINLNTDIKTHPTTGPLFGSFKVQLDVFMAPIRLYHAALHNNMLGIGLNMANVKLPVMTFTPKVIDPLNEPKDLDNSQVNPSCILSYLGLRGFGYTTELATRDFQMIPLLAVWEIYKNYYANKQEEIGYVIHTPFSMVDVTIDTVTAGGDPIQVTGTYPPTSHVVQPGDDLVITWTNPGTPDLTQILLEITYGSIPTFITVADAVDPATVVTAAGSLTAYFGSGMFGVPIISYKEIDDNQPLKVAPVLTEFPLKNIDDMRQALLSFYNPGVAFNINTQANFPPYSYLALSSSNVPNTLFSQEGLPIKTYQSDLHNNWLQTEWIDGPGGINEISAVDVSGGELRMDALILARKVYDMMNRIAVSGGSYDDWMDAVWANDRYTRAESPIYLGGLSKELVFQEVVSNSADAKGDEPLGSLAGKGILSNKHKGGYIVAKANEPCYIIGLISLTPRVDYSQGNNWDYALESLDDIHKPALDEIGFQELITEQMAWWSTYWQAGTPGKWVKQSAGKQPAWINYMTSVNEVRGNFAVKGDEMFMTLNRKYENQGATIRDLTTYIDPSKYNSIFAEESIDAQNFWAQISVDITARRIMSHKIMPNL